MLPAIVLSVALSQSLSMGDCRSLAKQIFAEDSAQLWARAAPSLKQQAGSDKNLQAWAAKFNRDFGKEIRVMSEGMSVRKTVTVYRRVSTYSNWARGVEMEMVVDGSGRLISFNGRMASSEAPTTYGNRKTKAHLRVPFQGTWYVLWGGRRWEENRHSSVSDQRFALDLLKLTKWGTSFEGAGTKNDDYAAWGESVVTPGDGVVVSVFDGVLDNDPRMIRPRVPVFGNYVVVKHGDGEYSLIAHLRHGSVQVKVGDRVSTGQQLAKVGNSGMSTEPHIHYQLMDRADWKHANGLPAQFHDYLADMRFIERGEPRRGESIGMAPEEASAGQR